MGDVVAPTGTPGNGIGGLLNANSGRAASDGNQSVGTLLAAIATAAASFGVQFLVFYILRWRLTRIYRPKTYLVAERQRVPAPPSGPWQWIKPLFTMPNATIIAKCGLDPYFFLRYLRMLVKIFLPAALVILPILLPINRYSGQEDSLTKGVNELGWPNVKPPSIRRLWAHLLLAVALILWFLYVVYLELRGYIRIRQAYLTSPQHRIRASATTVLVSGIPRKWLTIEALSGLYDVFPGGIRNIWINRDFDELLEKVKLRDKVAGQLEDAETKLIKLCVKKHRQAQEKKAKEQGKSLSRKQRKQRRDLEDQEAQQTAQGQGTSSGNPHQMPQDIHDAAEEYEDDGGSSEITQTEQPSLELKNPLKLVGQGLGTLGHGITSLGQKSKDLVGGVAQDIQSGVKTVNNVVDSANAGAGFVADDSLYQSPQEQNASTTSSAAKDIAQAPPSQQQSGGVRVVQDTEQRSSEQSGGRSAIHDNPKPSPAKPNSDSDMSATRSTPPRDGTSIDVFQPARSSAEEPRPSGLKGRVKALKHRSAIPFPSPSPQTLELSEYPMDDLGQGKDGSGPKSEQRLAKSKWAEAWSKWQFWRKRDATPKIEYPTAFDEGQAEDQDGEPEWKKHIEVKDRETLRLPVVSWMFSLPFVGKKVDRIYHLRKELARLNAEIEYDQDDVERFPIMGSAFIQFNHQVAAHLMVQSVSHHVPLAMAPRAVEISPNDVIWGNMSIKWWERYLRTAIVVVICVGLIVFFAIPVAFTGLLSQVNVVAARYAWLAWLANLPKVVISIIQGILPPVLLAVLLAVVPMIFRYLVKLQGVSTGTDQELGVQLFYYLFLFVQVFVVVSLSSSLTNLLTDLANNTTQVLLSSAENLPKASNYFLSYLAIQALGQSAGALLQGGTLFMFFLLGPLLDSTARQKWKRQTTLSSIQWGSYFPPFTNFATIGLIFSIISPIILVFNIVTFTLFYIVQRYNCLYVYQNSHDTGGLLFPRAVNQLFTGLYVMELVLAGLFFIAQNAAGNAAAVPQGVIMIVMVALTALFQVLLNSAFAPLMRYLPITLEDEAVVRDEAFARAQAAKFRGLTQEEPDERDSEDIQDRLEREERQEEEANRLAKEQERERIRDRRGSRADSRSTSRHLPDHGHNRHQAMQTKPTQKPSWKDRVVTTTTKPADALKRFTLPGNRLHRTTDLKSGTVSESTTATTRNGFGLHHHHHHHHHHRKDVRDMEEKRQHDLESQKQQQVAGDVLFSGFSDELEDLTPEERDTLVRYSFQHAALRARRPVVWIPRDPLGISDDEIARSKTMSTVAVGDGEGEKGQGEVGNDKAAAAGGGPGETRTNIWMSNANTALDGRNRVVFKSSPPDFASVDLIEL